MEKLEELLINDILENDHSLKIDLKAKKIRCYFVTSYLKHEFFFTLNTLIKKYNYNIIFVECTFIKYNIDIFKNLDWLIFNRNIHFVDCSYDSIQLLSDCSSIYSLFYNKIKIKSLGIDLSNINIHDIEFFNLEDIINNTNNINLKLSENRYIKLEKKDLEKILNNRKKLSIGCKSMTLQNWIKFFSQETYTFENERYTHNFKEIEFGFEKFLLLIQS